MLSIPASAQFSPINDEGPFVVLKNIIIIGGTCAESVPNKTLDINVNVIYAIFDSGPFPSSFDSRFGKEKLLKEFFIVESLL